MKLHDFLVHIDGLVQERRNSIANALELRLSCTNLSIWLYSDNFSDTHDAIWPSLSPCQAINPMCHFLVLGVYDNKIEFHVSSNILREQHHLTRGWLTSNLLDFFSPCVGLLSVGIHPELYNIAVTITTTSSTRAYKRVYVSTRY